MQKELLPIDSISLKSGKNVDSLIQAIKKKDIKDVVPVVLLANKNKYTVLSNSNFIIARKQLGFHSIECIVISSYDDYKENEALFVTGPEPELHHLSQAIETQEVVHEPDYIPGFDEPNPNPNPAFYSRGSLL